MDYLFHVDARSVADDGNELTIQRRIRKAISQRLSGVSFVAIPNGGQRSAWAGIKAKQEGMSAGFPDAMVLWAGGIAFVEIKTATGALSDQQHILLNWLHNAGFAVGVFRSVETCLSWLIEQGAPTTRQVAA